MSNKAVFFYLRALLALAGLLGFMYLYGRVMIPALRTTVGEPPVYSDAYTYVATALAGLVGGVAATSLGQASAVGYSLRRRFTILGRVLAPFQPENLQNWMAIAYTVIYIIYGVAAIIIWISAPTVTQGIELIRDLALIFIGLVLATAQSFLGTVVSNGGSSSPPEVPARRGQARATAKTVKPAKSAKPTKSVKRH